MFNEGRINIYLDPRLWKWDTVPGADDVVKFRGPFVSARWRYPVVDVRVTPTRHGYHIEWDRYAEDSE